MSVLPLDVDSAENRLLDRDWYHNPMGIIFNMSDVRPITLPGPSALVDPPEEPIVSPHLKIPVGLQMRAPPNKRQWPGLVACSRRERPPMVAQDWMTKKPSARTVQSKHAELVLATRFFILGEIAHAAVDINPRII